MTLVFAESLHSYTLCTIIILYCFRHYCVRMFICTCPFVQMQSDKRWMQSTSVCTEQICIPWQVQMLIRFCQISFSFKQSYIINSGRQTHSVLMHLLDFNTIVTRRNLHAELNNAKQCNVCASSTSNSTVYIYWPRLWCVRLNHQWWSNDVTLGPNQFKKNWIDTTHDTAIQNPQVSHFDTMRRSSERNGE